MTYQDYQKEQARLKSLSDFTFPVLKDADIAFSTVRTNTQLLELAKAQGFYNGHTPYNELFSTLFFKGGRIKYKQGVDPKAIDYLHALISSFEPKHEDKEAVCALILSEIAEV